MSDSDRRRRPPRPMGQPPRPGGSRPGRPAARRLPAAVPERSARRLRSAAAVGRPHRPAARRHPPGPRQPPFAPPDRGRQPGVARLRSPAPGGPPPANPAWPGSQPTQPRRRRQVPRRCRRPSPAPAGVAPACPRSSSPTRPAPPTRATARAPRGRRRRTTAWPSARWCAPSSGLRLLLRHRARPGGLGLGFLSRKRIRESNGTLRGDGLAITGHRASASVGVVLAIVGVVILATNPDAFEQHLRRSTTTTGG